jgi:uncharacterized membrane protein YagU involved in acid resistance
MTQPQGFARRRGVALERTLEKGVFCGVVASIPMGLFALLASGTYQSRGFYTPAYHVSFVIDPNTYGMSLTEAAAGERFFMSQESFVFGLALHVMVAGAFGALFAVLTTKLRLEGNRILIAGAAYGLAVMVLMSTLVLPTVGGLSDAGAPIAHMGGEIGWATFAALHVIYGLALGAWIYVRPQDFES